MNKIGQNHKKAIAFHGISTWLTCFSCGQMYQGMLFFMKGDLYFKSSMSIISFMQFDVPEKFSVVSYNILAERYAWKHRGLYTNVPLPYLKWNHRKRVICEELLMWNPDIICLQVSFFFSLSLSLLHLRVSARSYRLL